MDMIGIVCEYNPFHLGHAYHIRQARAMGGPDCGILCVLSGDFVQRGEAAVYSKYARAEAACRGGADLVVELPIPWCLSSAEGFARGAVGLLGALGVSALCFGSETGELSPLEELSRCLLQPGLQAEVRDLLSNDGSMSYAAARQEAVKARLGSLSALLSQPNNILAVEYLKAIYDLHLDLTPLPVLRAGNGHDRSDQEGFASASSLRKQIAAGKALDAHSPGQALAVFQKEREQGREIRDRSVFETAILSRLRMFDEQYFQSLPDAADGLGNRFYRAVREEAGYDAVLAAAQTKRYPLARIRRLSLCACLGVKAGMADGIPPYARVLAFSERGREMLRFIASHSALPLLTKPASVKQLSPSCQALFRLGADAHDFYVLGYPSRAERRPGADWRTGPKIL